MREKGCAEEKGNWAGERERRRRRLGREEKREKAGPAWKRVGLLCWVGLDTGFGFPSFLFLSSFSNKLKLNEFKSEFEFTQALKQNKEMLQHDATTKLNLR